MALFTHSHGDRKAAEVNPAAAYFSAAVICRNYVASRDKYHGTKYSEDYHDLERQGFRFMAHVPGEPGKMSTDVLMVKATESALEANAQWYGREMSSFSVNHGVSLGDKCRVVFSYDWGNNFRPSVIAGDCDKEEMFSHLESLAGPDARRALNKGY